MENLIKMDDLGVPLFSETSKKIHVDPPSWNSLPKSFQGDFLYGCMNFGVSWALGPIA